jgi:AAA15 family ATPase/GTPase
MLIEFSVSNFRSFREKQTFSLVAAPRLKKKNCVFKVDVKGEKLPDLLKVAAIYGPNASGKSNLLDAMGVATMIARLSPTSEARKLPVSPFRFDANLSDQPSRFEYHFVQDRQRYQFELAVTQTRIVEERLIGYPSGVESLLYERIHGTSGETYKMGTALEGGDDLHNAWKNLTGPQVLFISQAVANSNENLMQLRAPFAWLKSGFFVMGDDMTSMAQELASLGTRHPIIGEMVAKYLQEIDVPVTNIVFENLSSANNLSKMGMLLSSTLSLADIESSEQTAKKNKTTLTHATALGEADFDFSEESKGTKNLMGFFVPWSSLPNDIVIVDELDSSLHPKIVAALIKKHLLAENVGQLIFTTHDTHLMDTKLLRRDQFWLTERDANGATRLRSIHDFDGRESEDIEKRYYEGRYRALPILRQG